MAGKRYEGKRVTSTRRKKKGAPKSATVLTILLLIVIFGTVAVILIPKLTGYGNSVIQTTVKPPAATHQDPEDVQGTGNTEEPETEPKIDPNEIPYYPESAFGKENGRATFTMEGYYTRTGIDVSDWQGTIDWEAVAADGIEFVIVRMGYRGYETGRMVADTMYESYIRGATAAGLDVGVYFYSQAITSEEAVEEAEYVLQLLDGVTLTLPVFIDWEYGNSNTARTKLCGGETITQCCIAFCDTIAGSGYLPGIYLNKKLLDDIVDADALSTYSMWMAQYCDEPTCHNGFNYWQYSPVGNVNGISGEVDMDLMIKPLGAAPTNLPTVFP